MKTPDVSSSMIKRRHIVGASLGGLGLLALDRGEATAEDRAPGEAPIAAKDRLRITKLETLFVKPRWLFLKVHTNAGIAGLGEPVVEGRAATVATALKELEPYLVGKDPCRVVHHWQAIYRHAVYRGGPVLTSALSGVDMALWDIKGKALGVPVYELLGGPTRERMRVYVHARDAQGLKRGLAQGFTAFKTQPARRRRPRYVETPGEVHYAAEKFAELRKVAGDDVDIAVDFHGAISPATAKLLIKALEPFQPMFIGEPCLPQNHDIMAELARHPPANRDRGARLHQVGVSRGPGEAGSDNLAARPLPRRRNHRGPADRGDGGGVLRGHRSPQPTRAHLARRRYPDRCFHSQLPVPGAGKPGHRLLEKTVCGTARLSRASHGPRAWNRAR